MCPKFIIKGASTLALLWLLFANSMAFAQNRDADLLFLEAKNQGKNMKFAKAAQLCEEALEITPLDMDIKEYLGKCYMELGQVEKARITLLQVLAASPKRTDSRHYLINIETQAKRYSSAICYVNELLEITPYSKGLWTKKINLYILSNNKIEAERETKRLYQIFPQDSTIAALYNNITKENALALNKVNDPNEAIKIYNQALKASPKDKDTYLNLINTYIRMGNLEGAKSTADRALILIPNDSDILKKKVGILEEQKKYQEAIDVLKLANKTKPSPQNRALLIYLTEEAARYYKNSDPFELYSQVYEQTKSQEAYNYLLNTSIARGYYEQAQTLINTGLKKNPSSKQLLSKQLLIHQIRQDELASRKLILKLYALYPEDSDIKERYLASQFKDAKQAYIEQNYKAAIPAFSELTDQKEYQLAAKNYLFNSYVQTRKFDEAHEAINQLIAENPDEPQFVLQKSDLLSAQNDFLAAYELALFYLQENPESQEYSWMLQDNALHYIKYLQANQAYEKAYEIAQAVLDHDTYNMQAYLYAIQAQTALNNYEHAMDLCDQALTSYPNIKDLLLKKAQLHNKLKEQQPAFTILYELQDRYPYDLQIRTALYQQNLDYGNELLQIDSLDSAINYYNRALHLKKNDTIAVLKIADAYRLQKNYDSAHVVLDRALVLHPDEHQILYEKGKIYEEQHDFVQALAYTKKYKPSYLELEDHKAHLKYLEYKTLKNEAAIAYLFVGFDTIEVRNRSIASMEYTKIGKRNSVTLRGNYTARETGTGLQAELDWYHTFSNKMHFLANAGLANKFFPRYKANFSLYIPTNNDFEWEIGGRIARFVDKSNFITGIVGVKKNFDNAWISARYFNMRDSDRVYHNVLLESRFYSMNKKDYLSAMVSYGNAPVDQKLDFQLYSFLAYRNTMFGGGYTHFINYKTSIGCTANWYSYRNNAKTFTNQYTVFLTLKTRF